MMTKLWGKDDQFSFFFVLKTTFMSNLNITFGVGINVLQRNAQKVYEMFSFWLGEFYFENHALCSLNSSTPLKGLL